MGAASATEKPGKAMVTFLGEPGTRVSIDGVARGPCPVRLSLEPGQHDARFSFDPTSESLSEGFKVKAGEKMTVRAEFTGARPTVRIQRGPEESPSQALGSRVFMGMRKLEALLIAFGIIFVALMPGVGAVFTMKAGDRPPPPERVAPPQERIDLMGSYVAMQPGFEEGALALSRVRTSAPLPPNASPVLTR